MKNRSTITIFLGVLISVVGFVNVYHFADTKQPGNAIIGTVSAMAGGIIVANATAAERRKSPRK